MNSMTISIIVAVAKNLAIGKDNDLLWHLPADMKFFKEMTSGSCILTGRKNYFSIPDKFRPLPNRTNIVITRDESLKLEGAIVVNSIEQGIEEARKLNEKEIFIIGGGEIYRQSVHLANKMYITEVDAVFEDADTFYPEVDRNIWIEISRNHHPKNEKNTFDFDIVEYQKKKMYLTNN